MGGSGRRGPMSSSAFTTAGRRDSTITRSDMLTASAMSWVTSRAVLPSCRRMRQISADTASRVW